MPLQPFASIATAPTRPTRLRRSVLVVPGSDEKMLARAGERGADEIVLDLEDAVAPDAKRRARETVVEALCTRDYGDAVVAVRVNDVTTQHQYRDIVALVQGAGGRFDCLMLPKVDHPGQLWFVEHLLTQLEAEAGLDVRHGCEVQIESGRGVVNMVGTARVTDRIESLTFGPGDYAASIGVPQLEIGMPEPAYPGYQWAAVASQIVTVAQSVGADAIDGPYSDFRDADGFTQMATRAKLSGIDGKWCIHPSQVELANDLFTPTAQQFADATELLGAYREHAGAGRGAGLHNGRMIDEASRKMAEKLVARGRAAGLDAG
ncbi:aldolase/citrate lyase family protein [soil metagenome]